MKLTHALAAAALLVSVAACTDSTNLQGGRLQILLTDSPFPYDRIAHVNVHVVRVQVASHADTTSDAVWTTVAEPDRTIDLLELHSGQTTVLGEADVDATTVGAVRVVINTERSSVIDNAGQAVTVHWQGGPEKPVYAYVNSSLALFAPGTEHRLVIDFDVGRSFADANNDGTLIFMPWLRALDDAGAGAIEGVVRGRASAAAPLAPLANAAVTVLSGDENAAPHTWFKVATGRTDANGHYKVAFLLLGTYIVRAEPLGFPAVGCLDETGVLVSNGETTTLNLDLPAAPGTCALNTGGGGGIDSTGRDTSTVNAGPVHSVSVGLWPATVAVGDSLGAFATLTSATGVAIYGRPVTWTLSNTDVVEIRGTFGQSIILHARAAGSVTISATSEGKTGTSTIDVH